jgi:hypothetical protein
MYVGINLSKTFLMTLADQYFSCFTAKTLSYGEEKIKTSKELED